MAFLGVDAVDFADDTLLFADVVANALYPTGCDFSNVNESFLFWVFFKEDESAEVLHFVDGSDHQFPFFWEFVQFCHKRAKLASKIRA